ncbi:MAG: hypothetical protein DDT31_01623 [Syntrophomonadaceae bacterium]|nr:hypothetical protein [Bacillota bacterium]
MVFRRVLIMGRSKHGKTTSLYLYAKKQIERTGKKIFVINTDGGSEGFWEGSDIASYVRVVYPWAYESKLAVMRYASMGMIPMDDKARKVVQLPFNKYSDVLWDGITASSEMMLSHLAGHEDLIGVKHALAPAGTFMDGDERFSVNSMSHYNLVHKELKKMLQQGLFRLPLNCIITALMDEGEDENKGNVMGPATVGKAITSKIPAWLPDVLHQERYKTGGEIRFRLWFEGHEDKQSRLDILSGVRLLPQNKEEFAKFYPKGWIPVNEESGLMSLFDFREKNLSEGNLKDA